MEAYKPEILFLKQEDVIKAGLLDMKQILEITQLLAKYDVEMDKVYFDSNYNMTLYFEEARIKVGGFDNIDRPLTRYHTNSKSRGFSSGSLQRKISKLQRLQMLLPNHV